ncbi:MAG TPA: hypothetical protein VM123_15020 [archaeon]|nr:hypothetical protein [archaeon]
MLALAAGHFLFLISFSEPAISTPDANEYLARARLIATQGCTWLKPESPLQYTAPHWLTGEPVSPHPINFEERQKIMERCRSSNGTEISDKLLDDLAAWSRPDRKAYWIGIPGDMRGLVPSSDSLVVIARSEISSRDQSKTGPSEQFRGMPGARMPGGRPGRGGFSDDGMGPVFGSRRMVSALMEGGELVLAEWKRSPVKESLTDTQSIRSQ